MCRGKLVQEDLVQYSREVAFGMRHMHTMGYIHKRLRAEHVLMSPDDSCKVVFDETSIWNLNMEPLRYPPLNQDTLAGLLMHEE